MAVAFRKPQSAASSSAAVRLDAARSELAATEKQIGEVEKARVNAILGDENDTARKLDVQLENLQRDGRIQHDRVRLLEAEVAKEEDEKRVRENAARIERIEKMARDERSAAVAAFTDGITKADKALRSLIAAGRSLQAAHNFLPHDTLACLLAPSTIVVALQHEMFRIGGRARLYGGMDPPHADLTNFPGSKSPTLQLLGSPELVKPLASVLDEANDLLSRILRTGRGSGSAAVEVVQPQVDSVVPATNGGDAPVRSDAEERRGALLRRLAELGEDLTREAEYDDVVAALAKVDAEITAEQRIASQEHA
jgi:hypothetical protein